MDSLLKELFGGSDDAAAGTKAAAPEASAAAPAAPIDRDAALAAQRDARREARKKRKADEKSATQRKDFVERYTSGAPSEGFTAEEAIEHLADLREELSPAEFQVAMVRTLDNLPIDQRDDFIALMRKHKEAADTAATTAREAPATAPAASTAPAGTSAPAADPFGGLLTGLFGGTAAGGTGASAARGGGVPNVNDILNDLRTGGLNAPASSSGGQPTADDFLALLNSPLGKAVLGGLAAYGLQASQQDDDDDAPAQRQVDRQSSETG
jgi:hypothetical protein